MEKEKGASLIHGNFHPWQLSYLPLQRPPGTIPLLHSWCWCCCYSLTAGRNRRKTAKASWLRFTMFSAIHFLTKFLRSAGFLVLRRWAISRHRVSKLSSEGLRRRPGPAAAAPATCGRPAAGRPAMLLPASHSARRWASAVPTAGNEESDQM